MRRCLRDSATGEEDWGWAAGDVLHCETYRGINPPERENRRKSFATSVTSVTAARQTGRQVEKKNGRQADNQPWEG